MAAEIARGGGLYAQASFNAVMATAMRGSTVRASQQRDMFLINFRGMPFFSPYALTRASRPCSRK